MPRNQSYYVSGIIQIKVSAPNARAAVDKALAKQDALMNKQFLSVSVENITRADFAGDTVSLDDAEQLDEEGV